MSLKCFNRLAVEGLGTRLVAHISCRSWLSRREWILNTKWHGLKISSTSVSEFLYSMWGSKNLKDAANPTGDKERFKQKLIICRRHYWRSLSSNNYKKIEGLFFVLSGFFIILIPFSNLFLKSQMGENERSNTRCNVSKIKDVVNVGTVEVKQQGIRLTLEVDLCIYTPFFL